MPAPLSFADQAEWIAYACFAHSQASMCVPDRNAHLCDFTLSETSPYRRRAEHPIFFGYFDDHITLHRFLKCVSVAAGTRFGRRVSADHSLTAAAFP